MLQSVQREIQGQIHWKDIAYGREFMHRRKLAKLANYPQGNNQYPLQFCGKSHLYYYHFSRMYRVAKYVLDNERGNCPDH